MKLRLRSVQSKETVKIEVPNSCTIQHLKETLAQSISLAASSLYLSLNRKDELQASSPEELLQSLGITSGDLIYFSVNPNDFSFCFQPLSLGFSSSIGTQGHQGDAQEPMPEQLMNFQESASSNLNKLNIGGSLVQDSSVQGQYGLPGNDGNFLETKSEKSKFSPDVPGQEQYRELEVGEPNTSDAIIEERQPLDSKAQSGETLETQDLISGEVMDIDSGSLDVGSERFSEPYFLRRLLRKELGDDGSHYRLLVIAVHAVLIESGFAGFNSMSGARVDGFHLRQEQASKTFAVSLCYTLPELLDTESVAESVVLKFQSLGHFVNVYGCLAKGGSELYRVCFDQYKFAPVIDCVWSNDKSHGVNENDSSSMSYAENEIFDFWKIVKDGLALPLLIDLCEKTGLGLPSCLMRLPAELKLKILESLPAVDIAKMGCVSSEMRYLSANNDIWKKKFIEECGDGTGTQGTINWKKRFASYWENKKRKRDSNSWREYHRVPRLFGFPVRRDPDPFAFPPIIGGDYDRLPGLGIPPPGRPGHPGPGFPRYIMRRNFSPNCNLGGFSS